MDIWIIFGSFAALVALQAWPARRGHSRRPGDWR
jgi:hypothetical protein